MDRQAEIELTVFTKSGWNSNEINSATKLKRRAEETESSQDDINKNYIATSRIVAPIKMAGEDHHLERHSHGMLSRVHKWIFKRTRSASNTLATSDDCESLYSPLSESSPLLLPVFRFNHQHSLTRELVHCIANRVDYDEY